MAQRRGGDKQEFSIFDINGIHHAGRIAPSPGVSTTGRRVGRQDADDASASEALRACAAFRISGGGVLKPRLQGQGSEMLNAFTTADFVAAGWFVAVWILYGLAIENRRWSHLTLNGRMDTYRERWMQRMVEREVRIVDSTVMASLQNGTAFFASTALLALGGSLSLLRSSDEALAVFSALPLATETIRTAWEMKVVGLSVIFAYAFFKFAWAYRVMNYVAILIAATPNTTDVNDQRQAPWPAGPRP